MAGEFSLQFNTKAFSDPSLTYGANQAYDMSVENFPTTKSDATMRQFMLTFQDTRSDAVPHQHQNIVTDNNVGKRLDLSV